MRRNWNYLIKKFADLTNKKAGEFYTPRSVVRLMINILDPKEGESIYDPVVMSRFQHIPPVPQRAYAQCRPQQQIALAQKARWGKVEETAASCLDLLRVNSRSQMQARQNHRS